MGSTGPNVQTGWTCRLCCGKSMVVVNIFGQMGRKIHIQKKIHDYTPFKVDMYDDLPNTICLTCLKGVLQTYVYFKNSNEQMGKHINKKRKRY